MVTRQVAGTPYALTYDGDNRLVENRRSDNAAETYRYDGDGKLIERWSEGEHTIYIGGLLEIAIRPTGTPTATATATRTARPSRTPDTATPIGLTPTPSATRRPTYTPTKSQTPSRTASPTHVHTKTRTPTIPASATVTPTPTITRTVFTATPSKTPFTPVVVIATATHTPSVSRTPTRTWTATLAPTQTKSLTPSKTATATKTASKSPTPTLTYTPSPTATSIDTVTPVATRATAYPGGETWTFSYYAGSERIALRVSTGQSSAVYFLFGDHLGSTTVVMNANGSQQAVTKYKAFGEQRATPQDMMTDRLYTGQLEIGFGLYHYGARVYDVYLNRWLDPDSIVPDIYNPLDWDHYGYVRNNPVNRNDPSGHCSGNPNDTTNPDHACWEMISEIENTYSNIQINNQDKWLLEELNALWDALAGHVFIKEIKNAKSINFYRSSYYSSRVDGIAGSTRPLGGGNYNITIYDLAYLGKPNGSVGDKSINNFKSTIIHELAHVAIEENPLIQDSYLSRSNSTIPGLLRTYPKIGWSPS